MRALVTGATGFVGRRLLEHLDRPVVLTRDTRRASATLGARAGRIVAWNPLAGPAPAEAFEGVDAVFHLAGESVAEARWSAAQKRRILESRTVGTRHLVAGLSACAARPPVLVSASAVGFYGNRGDDELTEAEGPGHDFLADVCVAWEKEAEAARDLGMRVVAARTGIVLGAGGGALQRMLLPFKLGAGGPLGSGRQWMPWIHVTDLARLYLHAAATSTLVGPMNAVAPNPVRNVEFTKALARQLRRPAFLPAPYFGLRLAFGEFAKVLFDSQRVVPRAALESGFRFHYPDLAGALADILAPAAA